MFYYIEFTVEIALKTARFFVKGLNLVVKLG